jgi:hypothetical protein
MALQHMHSSCKSFHCIMLYFDQNSVCTFLQNTYFDQMPGFEVACKL